MKKVYGLVLAVLVITACNSKTETTNQQQEIKEEGSKVTLTDSGSSTDFPDATLNSFTYEDGKFSYDYEAENYTLGEQTDDERSKICANSGKGQHIHFIVNDEPYKAFYTADFDNEMEDGSYHILSFLSRSYHESIKNGKAHLAQKVTFEGGKVTKTEDITSPMLFYSRPKGTYTGADTETLLLDFFIVNTELSATGNKVKVTVNEEEIATVSDWKPYLLTGLPMGTNTVTLELIDAEGNRVDAPFNPVTREFELMKEAPVE